MASLAEVIPHFLNPDNTARQAAEQCFAQHRANPPVFMPQLLDLARTFPEAQMRQMCVVLLRRNLDQTMWPAVGAPGQTALKAGLLDGVITETDITVRKAIADTISKLASITSKSGGWAELLPFVFKLCIDADPSNKKLGLDILTSLSLEVGDEAIVPLLEPLLPVLGQSLSAPQPLPVRVACVKAISSIVPHVAQKEYRASQQALQGLLPGCFAVLQEALATGNMTNAKECLTSFIEVAEEDSGFLRPQVDTMLSVAFGVAGAKIDENVRHLGLELMVTFAENKPGIARKVPQFVETLFPVMCSMVVTVSADEEWDANLGDEDEKDEVEDNVRFGEEAMVRLFVAIGGNRSVPASLPIISSQLDSGKWQQRYAGLRALDQLVSSAEKSLKEHLPQIVARVVQLLADSKAQVAWAATGVLSALCSCFAPDVQQNFHQIILPALLAMLEPSSHGRLRTRAARCIIDFTAECDEDEAPMLASYSDAMVTSLMNLLTTGTVTQQSIAIQTLSSLATSLDEHFVKYYAHLMPGLVNILQGEVTGSNGKGGAELAGSAMWCVSCIADAVGRENFGRDAPAVMEILMALHARFSQGNEQNFASLLQACSRIAECMGSAFEPYLERLMPSIFALAELDPKLDMVSADGEDGDDDGEAAIMMIKGMGKMRVSINIKALQDKALGFSMMSAMSEHLKELYLPYVKRSAELLVPCCTYKLSGDVREAAIEALPHLLAGVHEAVSKGLVVGDTLKELLMFAWPQLLQASIVEPDAESQKSILSAISEIIDACGSGCLNADMQEQLCEVLRPLVEDHVKGEGKDEDDDEGGDGESTMMEVVDVMSSALKVAGAQIVPHVQQKLLPHFGQLLVANRSSDDKCAALNCLCEIVDHGGEAALPLVPNIAAACLQFCGDEDAAVRRSANYGLATCAEKGGSSFDETMVGQTLARLHPSIVAVGSRDGDNKWATDNAIDAIGRICKYRSSSVNTAEILPVWISWLPLKDDDDCAKLSHSFLADLIEAKHPAVEQQMAAVKAAMPTIMVPGSKLASAEVQHRLRTALAQGYGLSV